MNIRGQMCGVIRVSARSLVARVSWCETGGWRRGGLPSTTGFVNSKQVLAFTKIYTTLNYNRFALGIDANDHDGGEREGGPRLRWIDLL